MRHRFGFFDVDSREIDAAGNGLVYRARMKPIAPQLERLYSLAQDKHYPLVFTVCCSGKMPTPQSLPETLYVPMDRRDDSWSRAVDKHLIFYMEKTTFNDPKRNLECRAFDMFQHNGNADRLLRQLGVDAWVVFGNAFEYCVNAAAQGILRLGLPLIVLDDVRVSGSLSTPQSEQAVITMLRTQGARVMTLTEFLPLTECC